MASKRYIACLDDRFQYLSLSVLRWAGLRGMRGSPRPRSPRPAAAVLHAKPPPPAVRPGLTRASTSLRTKKDVDGRDKPGHDALD